MSTESFPATIIVPLLRQNDDWLAQCIRSALEQTVACEVIVVTSEHTPASNRRVLASLEDRGGRMRVRQRPDGARFAGALNFGIREARAERVGFLLSDDWLAPTAIEECVAFDADIVSTGVRFYAADGRARFPQLDHALDLERFERLPSTASKAEYLRHFFLFRRRKLLDVGGLDETLGDSPGVDDLDLIWVLLEHGASVAITAQPLYNCRDHEGERLTNRGVGEMTATLDRILTKHGMVGGAKALALARHARWFGRPVHVVAAEMAAALRPK